MSKKKNKATVKEIKPFNPVTRFLKIAAITLFGTMAAYGGLIVLDWFYQKIRPLVISMYEYVVNDWRGILVVVGIFAVVTVIFLIDTAIRNNRSASGKKNKKKKGESEEELEETPNNISSYSNKYNHYIDD